MKRYYELVLSGRQLALLLALFTALLLLAFGLGISVGLLQPGGEEITSAPVATEVPGIVVASDKSASQMDQPRVQPTAVLPISEIGLDATPTPLPSLLEETPPQPPISASHKLAVPAATVAPSPPPKKPTQKKTEVWVQVAVVSQKRNAEGVRQRVIAQGFRPTQVRVFRANDGKYRVRLGPFPDRESGNRVTERLRTSGFPNAFMVMR